MGASALFTGPLTVHFYIFGPMKNNLATVCYSNDDEVKNAPLQWFNQMGRKFFDTEIEKLVPRYDKCLKDYIEK